MPRLPARLFTLDGWPSQCAVCRAWPAHTVCTDCITRFAPVRARCPSCALPVAPGVMRCGACLLQPPPLDHCLTATGYEWPWAGLIARLKFQQDIGPDGAIYAGSPETVARKIAATVKTLGADRFDLKYANGTLDHGKLLHSIELYGEVVAPMVHDLLARG